MNNEKKHKRHAALLDDGMIEICADAKTTVVRKVRESDFTDWPDLEKPKAKRGRKKKVTSDDNDSGATESDS